MADESTPSSVTVAAVAIDQAAQEKAVELAAPAVAAAVDAAAAGVAAAEAAAKQLAEAALQTEIGRTVSALRSEYETWRTTIQNTVADQAAHLTQMQSELPPLREQLTAILASISLLTPPKSVEPVAEETVITEKVDPVDGGVQEVAETVPKPQNRRRWI